MDNEQLPDNVVPLRPRENPDCELIKVSLEDVYDDFLTEMKASIHDQVMSLWKRNLVDRTDLDEDIFIAEEVARVVIYQGMISLAANYASALDQEYDSVFIGVGTAKNLFLKFYNEDMEGE